MCSILIGGLVSFSVMGYGLSVLSYTYMQSSKEYCKMADFYPFMRNFKVQKCKRRTYDVKSEKEVHGDLL